MSYEVELVVELLIPDNVAFTAFNALKRMGYDIKELIRADYYHFVLPDEVDIKDFSKRIKNVDILVNANKHKAHIKRVGETEPGCFTVIVQDTEECLGLLNTLKERLGFNEIEEMEKGTLWKLSVEDKDTAKEITEALLCSKHYQKYEILS